MQQSPARHHRRSLGKPPELSPQSGAARHRRAVESVLGELDAGKLRVAEKIDGEWVTHQWIKKAVLLSFRLEDNRVMDDGDMRYFDKVPTKFEATTTSSSARAASASCRRPVVRAAASSARTSC